MKAVLVETLSVALVLAGIVMTTLSLRPWFRLVRDLNSAQPHRFSPWGLRYSKITRLHCKLFPDSNLRSEYIFFGVGGMLLAILGLIVLILATRLL